MRRYVHGRASRADLAAALLVDGGLASQRAGLMALDRMAAGCAEKWLQDKTKHRGALHAALVTGARLAAKHVLTGKVAADLILGYIAQLVPDATISLQPTPELLPDLVKSS